MKTLTLEISLKPFYALDDDATHAVCRAALRQWDSPARDAGSFSVMLRAADGAEILEYTGDLEAPMEWARFLGDANPHIPVPADLEQKSLHARNDLYRDDARSITYHRLAAIVRAWREAAAEIGHSIQVDVTFDLDGEFAPSTFNYERRREICLSNTMGKASFVSPTLLEVAGEAHLLASVESGGALLRPGPPDHASGLHHRLGLTVAAPLTGTHAENSYPPRGGAGQIAECFGLDHAIVTPFDPLG